MTRSAEQLRADALAIWRSGLEAVRSDRLVRETLRVEGSELAVGDELRLDLTQVRRIVVVGAGKAGAGMAAGVEQALGPKWSREKQLAGWINVPADCLECGVRSGGECGVRSAECGVEEPPNPYQPRSAYSALRTPHSALPPTPQSTIILHAARPAGVNEPTVEGERGSREILRLVAAMGPEDLCLCLISGGGSALLPAPIEGVSLADKLAVTRFLSAAGANIQELNTVRKQLSRIKGGGLARACRAGWLVTLIISDVIGDPLDVIGSGPTVEDTSTPQDALAVLEKYAARASGQVPAAVFEVFTRRAAEWHDAPRRDSPRGARCHNVVIGNNAVAVDAAGLEAVRRGYSPAMSVARALEGPAEDVGRHLAEMALAMRSQRGPDCLISGGEPVVQLVPAAQRGLGGRNQQLVLAALERLSRVRSAECGVRSEGGAPWGIVILSGGTDGEDGPTDAAGALIDAEIAARARARGLDAADHLRRNDAYHYFEPLGGLIKTGPTHTNVCDVRVVLVDREGERGA